MQIIKELILEYERPVSVCHVNSPIDKGLLALSETYPHVTFIGHATTDIDLTQDNILAISEPFTIETINRLALFEHFDIAYSFGNFQKESNRYQWIQALLGLADNVVIELPKDLHSLMSAFFQKLDAVAIKWIEDDVYVLAKRKCPKYYKDLWLETDAEVMPIISSRHYAVIESQGNTVSLDPGLSLYGFKILGGVYPKIETITQLLNEYQWPADSACLPWNIMLSGKRITWKKRFEEPSAWSKEGLNSCIRGLNIDEPKKYTRYSIEECNRLKLN